VGAPPAIPGGDGEEAAAALEGKVDVLVTRTTKQQVLDRVRLRGGVPSRARGAIPRAVITR